MALRLLLLAPLCVVSMISPVTAQELRVLGAGSLREVTAEIGKRYREANGAAVVADFGPSGLLRERIEKGEHADLFASADMGHPLKLLRDGRATRVAMFTRNTLCGVAVPKVGLTTANFLERLLDPSVKLGTSTPKADPAGITPGRCSAAPTYCAPAATKSWIKKRNKLSAAQQITLPSKVRIPPSLHSPRAGSTSLSDTAPARSCGSRKCQRSRS
jgi:hypothetical protein